MQPYPPSAPVQDQPDRRTDERTRKSLRYSVIDGAFSASMIGFGESFFVPYALLLKANAFQVAVLSALPQALGSLIQFFSTALIRLLGSRKRLVVTAALLQGAMYLPVALVFFFGAFRVYHLILFTCIYWAFGTVLSPAWNSWMGDLVNEHRRGHYFGRRSKITGMSTFLSFLAAGYILQAFGGDDRVQYLGFVVIFGLAFASRMASALYLSKKYEPPYAVPAEEEFTFIQFLREAGHRNYGRFVLYLGLMNLSVFVAAPFFTPYLLQDLQFSYLTFVLIHAAAIIVKLLSMPVWGRAADRFGTRRVLSLTGYLMPVVPVLWLFSHDIAYLIAIQVYSGFIWAGFEIAAFNFIFDCTSVQRRATCVAYSNMINGMALLVGALLGGAIVRSHLLFLSPYFMAFLASVLLRAAATLIFIPLLREVRTVEPIGYPRLFFKVVSNMPTMGLIYGLIPFRKKEKFEETTGGGTA